MGCASGKEKSADSKAIEKQLKQDSSTAASTLKLLLLGAGESGKSTFAKQLKILHLGGFTDEEKSHFREVIFENVNYSLRSLLEAAQSKDIKLAGENQEAAEAFLQSTSIHLDEEAGKKIKNITEDPAFTQALSLYTTFHLLDSAQYFLNNIERISAPGYVPTVDDLLRCRAKTTGIQELNLVQGKNKFTIIDVGGQRSERKKWVHCFEDVTAIIFFVALSEYDLCLYEDDSTNRMHESLKLFDEICNSKWFEKVPIILFLNKKDLFETKIKDKNITVAFPDYTGGQNYDEASKYVEEQFRSLNENVDEKAVYSYFTCATDTENIKLIFTSVKSILLEKAFDTIGF